MFSFVIYILSLFTNISNEEIICCDVFSREKCSPPLIFIPRGMQWSPIEKLGCFHSGIISDASYESRGEQISCFFFEVTLNIILIVSMGLCMSNYFWVLCKLLSKTDITSTRDTHGEMSMAELEFLFLCRSRSDIFYERLGSFLRLI